MVSKKRGGVISVLSSDKVLMVLLALVVLVALSSIVVSLSRSVNSAEPAKEALQPSAGPAQGKVALKILTPEQYDQQQSGVKP